MASHPVSDEVAATLCAFVAGGDGPTHSVLTGVFGRAGYGRVAPTTETTRNCNRTSKTVYVAP